MTSTSEQPLPTTLVERSVRGIQVQVHVATPTGGRSNAVQAAEQALDEFERVLQLDLADGESRELEQLSLSARSVTQGLAPGGPDLHDTAPILRAYAVDRCAERLAQLGVTDFLVSAGLVLRARGSKAGSHRGGWRVGLPPADPAGEPDGVVLLLDQAIHSSTASGRRASAVSPSALFAAAAPEGWTQRGGSPESIIQAAEETAVALRLVDEAGEARVSSAFDALLVSRAGQPAGASLDKSR